MARAAASGVAPIIVRSLFLPLSNANETMIGSPVGFAARTARRASSTSLKVSKSSASAPPSASASAWSLNASVTRLLVDLAGRQHLAGRPHRGEDTDAGSRCLLRELRSAAVDLDGPVRLAMRRQRHRVAPERVGQDDLAAGLDVRPRHGLDVRRAGQVPEIGRLRRSPARASGTRCPRRRR